MSNILNISQCNIAQIIGEGSRFLFHVLLIHISSCIIEKKTDFLNEELFRTLLITVMAIVMYHIFFRKIVEPKIEKMKLICYNKNTRLDKKKKIDKKDPSLSKTKYYRNKLKKYVNKETPAEYSRRYNTTQ